MVWGGCCTLPTGGIASTKRRKTGQTWQNAPVRSANTDQRVRIRLAALPREIVTADREASRSSSRSSSRTRSGKLCRDKLSGAYTNARIPPTLSSQY
jgi:hypothetical protein